jgi:hypothetical protein
MSRFVPGSCPCGTSLKTLQRVTYRIEGRVPAGNGYLTMADLDTALFAIDGVVNFTATLVRENRRDCLRLEVQLAGDLNTTQAALTGSIHQGIAQLQSIDLEISLVDRIPLSMAKRVIVDRRGADNG